MTHPPSHLPLKPWCSWMRAVREAHGIACTALSVHLGWSRARLWDIERGSLPTGQELTVWCKALNTRPPKRMVIPVQPTRLPRTQTSLRVIPAVGRVKLIETAKGFLESPYLTTSEVKYLVALLERRAKKFMVRRLSR